MTTQQNAVSETPSTDAPVTSHSEAAQAFVEQLRRMRETIPHFAIPTVKGGRQTLINSASLPPEFVELTTVARANSAALVRGDALSSAESRDLMAYADAYAPVAGELEALARFIRFSVDAAKARVGNEALTTYALARRLSRLPQYAHLAPHAADMRRALGKRAKGAAIARKKRAAAAAATVTPTVPPSSSSEEK
jgi:hypothetical protein